MSFTSTDPSGLTFTPRNGDGTGIVDISGTLIADAVYAPGSIVRMAHYRQAGKLSSDGTYNMIDNSCSFIPLPVDSSSIITCEAYFNYYNGYYGDTEYKITLSVSGDITTQDYCGIKHINNVGGGGRFSGRPLIISKDISPQNNDTFTVNLKTTYINPSSPIAPYILTSYSPITFIFFQIAK